jgi:hypothetical protein
MDPAESYILIENSCTIFKGLLQFGGRADFSQTSAPHSLMKTYRKKLYFQLSAIRSILPDSNFNGNPATT